MLKAEYLERVEEELYGNYQLDLWRAVDIMARRAKTVAMFHRRHDTPREAADELARRYSIQPLARNGG